MAASSVVSLVRRCRLDSSPANTASRATDRHVPNFNNYPQGSAAAAAPYSAYQSTSQNSSSAASPNHADARLKSEAAGTPGVPQSLEEASRLAAEEDKRRRNTAASARFRVKKKQREQALEKTAKDMTDRVTFLENRVSTLEMENKLLKDLITEKSGAASVDVDLLKKRVESKRRGEIDSDAERRRHDVKIESAAIAAVDASR